MLRLMLMVIFGAGASYDAVGTLKPQARVPMVNDLFCWERGAYANVSDRFRASTPLIQELRASIDANPQISLEGELDRLQELAKDHPDTARQMLALRFYLAQLIELVSDGVMKDSAGFTSYVELLRRIGRWQHRTNEEVALVTFNYDTMLEAALARQTGTRQMTDLGDYVHTSPWRVFKLHGSVSWSRFIERGAEHRAPNPDYAISLGAQLDPRDGDIVAKPFHGGWGAVQGVVVPAIAIPTIGKTGLECPKDHQLVFRESLKRVNRVLVIGWRGAESHIQRELREFQSRAVNVGIVDSGIEGAQAAAVNLGEIFGSDPRLFDAPGFAQFAKWDLVDKWLEEPAPRPAP
jgi:hypothetical protein